MTIRTLVSLFTAGLCVVGVSGCGGHSAAETTALSESKRLAAIDRVTAGKPQQKDMKLFTTQPGRIEAFEETPLFPKVAGYVEKLLVDIGDRVAKGDLLLQLSVPELIDEKEQKEALVAQFEAEIKQAAAAVVASQASLQSYAARIQQAEAGIGRAEGEYQKAKAEHERLQELAANRSVSQKVVDESLNQFQAAQSSKKEAEANVLSAQASLAEAEANVHKAQADQVAAEARLRVAKANLAQAETMINYTQIRSPFDGVITQREIDTGHFVQPASGSGSKPLFVVASIDRVRIFVDVPEIEAPWIDAGEKGDAAVVRVQSLGATKYDAKVTRTSWALDTTNRSLRTEIDIDNPEGILRPGMYASVTILLDQRSSVLALPISAIVREGDHSYCCVVESGKIARNELKLGLRTKDEIEIVSGIEGGQTVVLARADSLVTGQSVEVIETETK